MNSDKKEIKRVIWQVALFIITFFTTTLAGVQWAYGKSVFMEDFSWADFQSGLAFSIPLLTILTVHEFGHYFVALYHRVKTSLPYYIPIPPIPYLPFSFGTFGAIIRLRSRPKNNIETFDIGLAGPLAGFVVAIAFLIYGYSTLPSSDYVFQFHPEYQQYGENYADVVYSKKYYDAIAADTTKAGAFDVIIGKNLMFYIADQFVEDKSVIPNEHELMHYPLLLAVYFALFVTSLNLLPIGQLDGGHVIYGLFGFKKHKLIASVFFVAIMIFGGLGLPWINLNDHSALNLLWILGYILFIYIALTGLQLNATNTWMWTFIVVSLHFISAILLPSFKGFDTWLIMGFLLGRFIGIQHPPSEVEQPLDTKRIILGWLTLLIFVLCFVPVPVQIELILPVK